MLPVFLFPVINVLPDHELPVRGAQQIGADLLQVMYTLCLIEGVTEEQGILVNPCLDTQSPEELDVEFSVVPNESGGGVIRKEHSGVRNELFTNDIDMTR